MAAVNVVADVPAGITSVAVHRNLLFENNLVSDTPALAMLIASADSVTVRNLSIVDSNTQPPGKTGSAIDAQEKASVMVTRASKVTIADLSQTSTRTTYAVGVYVDPRNTANVQVTSSERKRPVRH